LASNEDRRYNLAKYYTSAGSVCPIELLSLATSQSTNTLEVPLFMNDITTEVENVNEKYSTAKPEFVDMRV